MKSDEFLTNVEGMRDPKYGGIITNVCKLPVGTKFYVRNGAWIGTICRDDVGLFIHVDKSTIHRFEEYDDHYLSIDIISNNDTKTKNMKTSVTIENVTNACSLCKNKDKCDKCVINTDSVIPSNFLADVSKVTPHFVDSYYELLNRYIHLLKLNGTNYKLNIFDIGD